MANFKIIIALGLLAVFIFKFSGIDKTKKALANAKDFTKDAKKQLDNLDDEISGGDSRDVGDV